MIVITLILKAAVVYLLFGVLFTIPFLWKGISKIDEGSKHSSVGFRVIIIPGIIVFWPVLMNKWIININGKNKRK